MAIGLNFEKALMAIYGPIFATMGSKDSPVCKTGRHLVDFSPV